MVFRSFLLLPFVLIPQNGESFIHPVIRSETSRRCGWTVVPTSALQAQEQDDASESTSVDADMNPVTRASWYAVEAFGKVFGDKTAKKDGTITSLDEPPKSLDETLKRIELDNDRTYFLSGQVDKLIYDEQCVFSDPFVAFEGRDRFVENLQNLGSFITKYSAKMLDYDTSSKNVVKTKVMVKLELNLPWKPILAWPWGVTYTIDPETFLITNHEESWDIKAFDGVKQIFRKPTLTI